MSAQILFLFIIHKFIPRFKLANPFVASLCLSLDSVQEKVCVRSILSYLSSSTVWSLCLHLLLNKQNKFLNSPLYTNNHGQKKRDNCELKRMVTKNIYSGDNVGKGEPLSLFHIHSHSHWITQSYRHTHTLIPIFP